MKKYLLLLLFVLVCTGCNAGPGWERRTVILRQEQAEVPSPTLGDIPLAQRFTVPAGGLDLIELLLVVPQGAPELPARPVTWELRDEQGALVDAGRLETATFVHNTPLRFVVEPQTESAHKSYEIRVQAPPEAGIALWASREDRLADGWLGQDGQILGNDLWLRASGSSTPLTTIEELRPLAERWRAQALWLPLLLFAPGALLFALLRRRDEAAEPDAFGPPITALGLSLAAIPLLYLWLGLTPLKLTDDFLRTLLQVAALAVILVAVRQSGRARAWLGHVTRAWPALLILLLLIAGAAASRLLQVRDVVLPPWVDGVHHTMVVEMFQQQSGLPRTYRPFLPIDEFSYHFGFHALAAVLAQTSQHPAPETVLFWGQVVNVAVLPGLFLLARRLARTTWAGLWALAVPLLALLPAYFTTWGRYTQLLGLAVLPIALDAALDWLQAPGGWRDRSQLGRLAVAALLGAGLVVIHYRVLVYYAVFLGLYLLLTWLVRSREEAGAIAQTGRLVLLALAVVVVSAPWLWRISREVVAPLAGAGLLQGTEEYNAIPQAFLDIDITPWLFRMAGLGLAIAFVIRPRPTLLLALWVGLLALIANATRVADTENTVLNGLLRVTALISDPTRFGIRPPWLINNESLVISYWLPAALATGLGWGMVTEGLTRRLPRVPKALVATVVAGLLLAAGLYGAWWRVDVINQETILATEEDVEAAQWVIETTPARAKFLINSTLWQGTTYRGSDGGYWLPVLTHRETTLPPSLYQYADPAVRQQINDLAQTVAARDNLDDLAVRDRLRALGVTHVYVGSRGGSLDLEKLRTQPALRQVYPAVGAPEGGVHIFELLPTG
ncbi:MAG TPA: DUF6541 family protein [Ardenticatenaceae bacterium]|nr:DUF6541 family protein [Ardenticatenaceae bacterium]